MKKTQNPFNITKAVDYTDEELNSFWVDFPSELGFNGIVKPTSDMPMIILGSKGSGKTHLMKHFSFSTQHLRNKQDVLKGIQTEGYIGVYLRCSGLNGFKFKDKGETLDQWQTIFSYYLELWLSQLLLRNIITLLEDRLLNIPNEHILCLEILDLFDSTSEDLNVKSLNHLVKYFSDLQKKIDYAINNKPFTNKKISESIEILTSAGKLIFGIPEILEREIPEFNGLKFLYLLDEYENFTEDQQKYFNTLLRERRNPTCFKIGARRYGMRTYQTLSAGEEIKSGSEFENFDIDTIFRDNKEGYKRFITEICIKRLNSAGMKITADEFIKFFETFNSSDFLATLQRGERLHLKRLERKLNTSKLRHLSSKIIRSLAFQEDVLLERINIMLFYREWKRGTDLLSACEKIAISCSRYHHQKSQNDHYKIIEKFKYDIIDTLARENYEKITSPIGYDNIVKMSCGIPRHVLIIMKHIFKWNDYSEVRTFKSSKTKISIETQLNAIRDTAKWFVEDARIPGANGSRGKDSIDRLCDYLRELRFSDIPPECSISTFSVKSKYKDNNVTEIIDFLEQYSYIIAVPSRRDKNDNSRYNTYQINGLLSVMWELSLSRRGIVNLNLDMLKAIFDPRNEDEFKERLADEKAKYNSPFVSRNFNQSLFDFE